MSRILYTIAFSLLGSLLVTEPLLAQSECEHRRDLSTVLDAAGSTPVHIVAHAGSLRITGRPALSEVRVTAIACASRASLLDEMSLDVDRGGGGVYVEARIPSTSGWFSGSRYARIDMVVEVPEASPLEVNDGSGSVEITGIRGGLRIEDGSGSLTIRDTGGDMRVEDGSGSITIETVRGSVVIEEDGSGSIDIRDVAGNVLIREDGSGGIDVYRVGGDFTVERAGSGGLDYGEIAGSVRVPRRR